MMQLVSQQALCGAHRRRPPGAESGGRGPRPELRQGRPLPPVHRYVQSLLDIMVFLDKDPEDQRTLSQ